MTIDKRVFLVCYDYGMGGLWGTFLAHSEQEILDLYPELLIMRERPKWMADEDFEGLLDRELHDIDGTPWGILNAVIANRDQQ